LFEVTYKMQVMGNNRANCNQLDTILARAIGSLGH
jgi:hypothetical protein